MPPLTYNVTRQNVSAFCKCCTRQPGGVNASHIKERTTGRQTQRLTCPTWMTSSTPDCHVAQIQPADGQRTIKACSQHMNWTELACNKSRPSSLVECYSNHKITRISIQTAGLAFGGTGLCSYRVRSVDGICAQHLTVESYTVFICQQSYLLLFGIPSPTHSFIPGLKTSFSANPSYCSPSFLLLKYSLRGFPGLFTVISEHICFLLLVFFFCFYTF